MIVVWNCKGSACISLYRGEEEGGGPYHIFVFLCVFAFVFVFVFVFSMYMYVFVFVIVFSILFVLNFFCMQLIMGGRGRERLTCQACTSLTGKLYFQIFLICVFASGFSLCVFVSF